MTSLIRHKATKSPAVALCHTSTISSMDIGVNNETIASGSGLSESG
jgi:hypothetical protein